jgi:hypothetical protein
VTPLFAITTAFLRPAALFCAAFSFLAAAGGAHAEERENPLRWLGTQPLTLFDLGVMRLERDVSAHAPWLAEAEGTSDPTLAGVQYDFRNRRLVLYVAMYRPRAERTEANCVALFHRLVERLLAHAPEGPGRAAWYLEKTFMPVGRERIGNGDLGRHLLDAVHAEITLRGRADDARAAETGRMTCRGRLDAAGADIERQFVN